MSNKEERIYPGELLSKARKKKRRRYKKLSDELGIPEKYLEALESNNFDEMAGPTYVKGYLRAYARNLNTHKSYRMMRYIRAIQRDNYGELNSLELIDYLDKYAETGKEYTAILKKIIQQNSLTDFDDVKILPNSEAVKNLI